MKLFMDEYFFELNERESHKKIVLRITYAS